MRDYIYELTDNGYYISIDGQKSIHQYEPYIPYPDLGYEGSAKAQIKDMQINDYANEVFNKQTSIENIPQEFQEEVKKHVKDLELQENRQPASKGEVTEIELALAEVYETILGGNA